MLTVCKFIRSFLFYPLDQEDLKQEKSNIILKRVNEYFSVLELYEIAKTHLGLEASQRDLQMQTRTQSKLHLGKVASNQLGVLRRAVRAAPSRRALIGVCDAQARTALGERRHCSSCTGARACTCTTPTDRRRSPTPACSACTTW